MTILEMIDRLEAEILSLQEARTSLVSAPPDAEPGKRAPAKSGRAHGAKRSKPKKAAKAKGKKSKSRKEALAGEQMAFPAAPAAEQYTAPLTGKRRALGRSLIHLRKLATAAREAANSEHAE